MNDHDVGERRIVMEVIIASVHEVKQALSDYMRKLHDLETDHEARIRMLESGQLVSTEELRLMSARLEGLEESIKAMPAQIRLLLGAHEKTEMRLMLGIAGGVLLSAVGIIASLAIEIAR